MLRRRSLWLLLFLTCLPLIAGATEQEEALRAAASSGSIEVVRTLIAGGVDVNAANDYGGTALSFAADKGHLEIVKLLVEHGADVNVHDTFYDSSPIVWATYNGHREVISYLLKHGATGASSVLRAAIFSQDIETIRLVLAAGQLSVEDLANALSTANRLEESDERAEIVALLEKAGAKPLPPSDYVIEPQILKRYAGTYRWQEVDATLIVNDDGVLEVSFPGGGSTSLEALDATTFRPQGRATSTFRFQVGDGRVAGFVFQRPEQEPLEFTRVEPAAETQVAEAEPPAAEAQVAEDASPAGDTEAPAAAAALPPAAVAKATSPHWPAFRGTNAAGVAEGYRVPVTWNVEEGLNVRWKTAIPGRAHSSPIIWGDRLFVTTAVAADDETPFRHGLYGDVDIVKIESKYSWRIYALDKRSGEILWQRVVHEGVPRAAHHIKATQANATPATDGRHVAAVVGSEGLFCYSVDGELRWRRDLGVIDAGWFYDPYYQWGHSSSPIIYKDMVIVQADRNRDAFIVAYALADGRELWRTPRANLPSWGTPTILRAQDQVELITNGSRHIRAYDPLTGKELWRLAPTAEVTVGTPVVGHGLVFVTGRYTPVQPIYAIRPGGRGDISLPEGADSSDHIAWSDLRAGTYIPTPIVYGDYLYTNHMNGGLTCYRAATGERIYRERLGGRAGAFTASPLAADGKLYLTSEEGETFVVKAGARYELLATNPIGEIVMATPAISEGMIYVRSLDHLVGIGQAADPSREE
ncbi:MAG: PQQ-binding-like beta-propeller repeat protein [bacterium]|nr:PQQ-binding-like beta-propeller repeat protein [bacterium]